MTKDNIKILWIEEETGNAMAERRGYLESCLEYEIEILESFADAMMHIDRFQVFDVVIIDIRIPKGFLKEDLDFHPHYNSFGLNIIKKANKKDNIMIYTNESWEDIKTELEPLGITNDRFLQKTKCRSNKMFEEFILKITAKK